MTDDEKGLEFDRVAVTAFSPGFGGFGGVVATIRPLREAQRLSQDVPDCGRI